MNFGLQEDIALPLVFIDGITRCGKSAFSGIIPSLTKMEQIQFSTELELIVSGLSLDGLNIQYAKSFVRIHLNERSYNLHLSRNVNFRPSDQTGIENFKDPNIYIERLSAPEGPKVVDICRSSENYLPFQSHDFLVNLKQLSALDLNYKMLSLWRHPIDTIFSWWTRGWGERFNGDPTGFSLIVQGEVEQYPWYAAGFSGELQGLNPMEKCIRIATNLLTRAVDSYRSAEDQSGIHIFRFEEFCVSPNSELEKICDFLNVDCTNHTREKLKLARFPRKIDEQERLTKLEKFRSEVREEYFDLLMEHANQYEADCYGLLPSKPGFKY